jgi:hypothetical protein
MTTREAAQQRGRLQQSIASIVERVCGKVRFRVVAACSTVGLLACWSGNMHQHALRFTEIVCISPMFIVIHDTCQHRTTLKPDQREHKVAQNTTEGHHGSAGLE